MKAASAISKARCQAGIMLIQCLVYLVVFTILTGVGMGAFYLCWNNSRAVICATDDIGSALHAGERWRADVRQATGVISVATSAAGERVQIPGPVNIVYHFEAGEVRREFPASNKSELLLSKVKTSRMTLDAREGVTAWRWELELVVRRPETQLPLLFTFEAAQTKP
jgi:hypothetical protein